MDWVVKLLAMLVIMAVELVLVEVMKLMAVVGLVKNLTVSVFKHRSCNWTG